MTIKQRVTTFEDATGQVLDTKIRNLYNPFNPEKGYNFKYKSRSIKSYLDVPLPDEFSDAELGKIFRLSRLIYANSNMLGKRVGNYIKAYSQKEIIGIFGLKDRQGRALFKKIIDNKIIKPYPAEESGKKVTQYYFNPLYFFSGTYLNVNLFILFQEELNDHLPAHIVAKFLEQYESTKAESTKAN